MNNKLVLAIESSRGKCSVCIFESMANYFSAALTQRHSHARELAPMIQNSLKSFHSHWEDIGTIAVSAGPGSFTGLRVGISASKGISIARGIPLVLVPTFGAIAMQISQTLPQLARFSVIGKASSDEYYLQQYHTLESIPNSLSDIIIKQKTDLQSELQELDTLVLEENWFNAKKYVILSSPDPHFVADWAAKYGTPIFPNNIDNVEPLYIKDFVIKQKAKI